MSMRSKMHRRLTSDGFTLIELLIVLIFIGVITTLAMPRVDVERSRADAAAQSLRVTLQQAQRTALLRQHDVMVTIDTATGVVRLAEDRNNNRRVEGGERIARTPLEEGARLALPVRRIGGGTAAGPLVGTFTVVDAMPTLVMRRDGSASTDAEIYLATGVGTKRQWRAVSIARATGRVEWFRGGRDGNWKRGGL